MNSGKSIVIADDHWATRMGVRVALEMDGFKVVGEATTADEAVDVILEQEPDLCLLDVRMPGGGIDAARRVTEQSPQTAVVMLTASDEDEDLLDALKAGASGYLLKGMEPDRLSLAVAAVLEGEAVLPRNLVIKMADEFHGRGKRMKSSREGVAADLTDREWEVLNLLRDGMKTSQVAERLSVSQVTIRTHVSAILRKLRVPDRKSALAMLENDEA
jgi:DNA-binding NarL/FixJ family response regulator